MLTRMSANRNKLILKLLSFSFFFNFLFSFSKPLFINLVFLKKFNQIIIKNKSTIYKISNCLIPSINPWIEQNKYLTFDIWNKMSSLDEPNAIEYDNSKKFNFFTKNSKIKKNILNLFFFFNYSYSNKQFNHHFKYNFFYLKNKKNNILILDLNKIISRWNDAYNLIFNIFYYNLNPLIFGSPLFKREILSLNWQYSTFDFDLWRYYFPLFLFKVNKYSSMTDFFFERLSMLEINFFIITDCHYHYKNLHYINKKHFYNLSLVDVNTNPWITMYPVLTFFENFLSQSFFFKLLIFIDRQSLVFKYTFFKKNWFNFKLKLLFNGI